VKVVGPGRTGLLNAITSTFRDLGVDVQRAEVNSDADAVNNTFLVTDAKGKPLDKAGRELLQQTLAVVLATAGGSRRPMAKPDPTGTVVDASKKQDQLYMLMDEKLKNDVLALQTSIVGHVEYTLARSRYKFDDEEAYMATAHSVRDRLLEEWNDTNTWFKEEDPKRVYYLSMEYLQGRALMNAVYNLGVEPNYREALTELGYNLETIAEEERDAALGNGGLGRLASCFLDSMAAMDLPAWGYGIRYQYGMFRQSIVDGFQHENPDYWLTFGNPWEIQRETVSYPVRFYGHVSVFEENGRQIWRWHPQEEVVAVAYDNPIPGYNTPNCINLRLWAAKPKKGFDLEAFNTGDYVQAILSRQRAETISAVLYPDDRTYEGKELRLRQQYFFTSASLQDVVRRFTERHSNWDEFPKKAQFQLNDTHPVIAVPELMRLLMDEQRLGWTKAWDITTQVFAFTNHTVMPEAIESWEVRMVEKLLPRHMQIIYDINWRFLEQVKRKYGENVDPELMGRLSIIADEYGAKKVRMGNLAIVASHHVNGVAAIHSELIKETIFKDFYDFWPEKFQNKTNGVTQRRWLAFCNPKLSALITEELGSNDWITDLYKLKVLAKKADDKVFHEKWEAVKRHNKERLKQLIFDKTGEEVPLDAMYDVQVKRIHEYKRQLLNIFGVIHRYQRIKGGEELPPKVVIFGGKAAPGYDMAKRIIKLICAVAEKINNDPAVGDKLKVIFLPDYNVSSAEVIIPGAEISEHISTAGTEASGTSNMKFAMNGSLIIGTMDGANVEIAEEIGEDNMFIFGALAEDVPRLREERATYATDGRFNSVLEMIGSNAFGWSDFFQPIIDTVSGANDRYLVANDFGAYLDAQDAVDKAYVDKETWTKMSIMSVAGMGKFSSDRTIGEYAQDIWEVKPCRRPEDGSQEARDFKLKSMASVDDLAL